jgi:hypothetical protein
MSAPTVLAPSLLECIPDPDRIRTRLSVLFAEARLLRQLLRVSTAVDEYLPEIRGECQEVKRAS